MDATEHTMLATSTVSAAGNATLHGGPHTAPRINLPRGIGRSAWMEASRAGLRVLMDSERTEDIITAEELTAQNQLTHLLASGLMSDGEGPALMRAKADLGDVTLEQMRAMPAGSLGAEVARFFDDNQLDTKLYGVESVHTPDAEAAYLMKRLRNSHDIWHVLMGFTTDGHEEILIHSFSLAQTGLPSSVALMVFGSLKHMVLEARWGCLRSGLAEAYRRGRDAAPLLPVYWERHLEKPLVEVRRTLGIVPWSDADRAATAPWRLQGPRRAAA